MNEPKWKQFVRPGAFIFVLVSFVIISTLDLFFADKSIPESIYKVYENIIITMIVMFYGSRGAEKISNILKKENINT